MTGSFGSLLRAKSGRRRIVFSNERCQTNWDVAGTRVRVWIPYGSLDLLILRSDCFTIFFRYLRLYAVYVCREFYRFAFFFQIHHFQSVLPKICKYYNIYILLKIYKYILLEMYKQINLYKCINTKCLYSITFIYKYAYIQVYMSTF